MLTPAQVGWCLLIFIVFAQAMRWYQGKYICLYCGRYKSHDPHCPYTTML